MTRNQNMNVRFSPHGKQLKCHLNNTVVIECPTLKKIKRKFARSPARVQDYLEGYYYPCSPHQTEKCVLSDLFAALLLLLLPLYPTSSAWMPSKYWYWRLDPLTLTIRLSLEMWKLFHGELEYRALHFSMKEMQEHTSANRIYNIHTQIVSLLEYQSNPDWWLY
jgi:hypothetical protein